MSLLELLQTMPVFYLVVIVFLTMFWFALLMELYRGNREQCANRALKRLHALYRDSKELRTLPWFAWHILPYLEESSELRSLRDNRVYFVLT